MKRPMRFVRTGSRKQPWFGFALLAIGLAFACSQIWRWSELEPEVKRVDGEADRARSGALTKSRSIPTPDFPTEKIAAIERELLLPWEALFAGLEKAREPGVQLLSIEPQARSGEVLITGQAAAFTSALGYVERLGRHGLREVDLVSHQKQIAQPGQPVRFIVRAFWHAGSNPPNESTAKR